MNMIREYYENGISSGIEITCDKVCAVVEGRDWKAVLDTMKERIIFIDEGIVLAIADGAAFGSEMDRVMKLLDKKKNIVLYLLESFEWLILKSDILNDKEVREILMDVSQYVESSEYFSWERYFTTLLIEKTRRKR